MPLGQTLSVTLVGLAAHVVTVEADIGSGLPGLVITGMPDPAVKQSSHRIKPAIGNSHERWPTRKITIGLSPATVPKSGSGFDLAIAVAVLAADGSLPADVVRSMIMLAELGLDGRLRHVTGVLPAVIGAVRSGHCAVVVACVDADEARLVPGVAVIATCSLAQLCGRLRGEPVEPCDHQTVAPRGGCVPPDLADVVGQPVARHAVEVAAAGGHHLLLTGPPGVGKTMLAERLPGLLPPLGDDAAMEVSAIHSLLGRLPEGQSLVRSPPFCAPHHSATPAALVGGGTGVPRPGMISLAHHGVLFLDEAPEFAGVVLESLRQPLESGRVTIGRAASVVTYPCQFQLVLAANPCPCARGGRTSARGACSCTPMQVRRYRQRLSGPLLDRIDIVSELAPSSPAVLDGDVGEPTCTVADRVAVARERSLVRLAGTPWTTNAAVPGAELRRHWPVPSQALHGLRRDLDDGRASTRGIDRVLKVAWTLADLGGRDCPSSDDVALAGEMRFGRSGLARRRSA